MSHAPRRRSSCASVLALLVGVALAAQAHAAPPLTRAQADVLAASAPSSSRDRALIGWARHATPSELAWLLRHTPRELGSAEQPLLEVALGSLPGGHDRWRERLLARVALAGPRSRGKGAAPPSDLSALRPLASVYRVAVLLPDDGDYTSYSRSVRQALAEGLRWGRAPGALPVELDTLGTGDSDPERVAAALEHAAARSEIVVGELLSVPTLSIATAARLAGFAVVSPTATDERISRVGPRVFQVGPGAEARARALAAVVLGKDAHLVAIASSPLGARDAFVTAFVREVESRGGRIVRREVVPTTGRDAGPLAVSLKASGADVLLWNGPGRDAEALVRALATAGAALRMCGGPALAPELARAPVRPLMEGMVYVADDWRLPAEMRARLDSLAVATGGRAGSLWTRGFLAGRRIAAALDAGALSADEVAAAWRSLGSGPAAGGFLDVARDGATLPVFVVRRGRSVDAASAEAQ